LQNGKTPTLYTDVSNPSSNTAYKNIGYVEQSPIDEVSLERENSFDSISDK
jgi:predicted GNAT family acetyltransferase